MHVKVLQTSVYFIIYIVCLFMSFKFKKILAQTYMVICMDIKYTL